MITQNMLDNYFKAVVRKLTKNINFWWPSRNSGLPLEQNIVSACASVFENEGFFTYSEFPFKDSKNIKASPRLDFFSVSKDQESIVIGEMKSDRGGRKYNGSNDSCKTYEEIIKDYNRMMNLVISDHYFPSDNHTIDKTLKKSLQLSVKQVLIFNAFWTEESIKLKELSDFLDCKFDLSQFAIGKFKESKQIAQIITSSNFYKEKYKIDNNSKHDQGLHLFIIVDQINSKNWSN